MQTIWLDDLDLGHAIQGWERPKRNVSVIGAPLTIGGRRFARGMGTHTIGQMFVRLAGGSSRFQAFAGCDDAVGLGRMRFIVRGDGRTLFDSGLVEGKQPARAIDIDVAGVDLLELFVDAIDDFTHHGHANWCEAQFHVTGTTPVTCPRPRSAAVVRTPATARAPARTPRAPGACATPPMGWNSWNGFAQHVTQADIERQAQALVSSGLAEFGYRFVNIDDGWQGTRSRASAIPWALQPNDKFPDLPGLVQRLHGMGLEAGIYSVVCVHSPQGLTGGSADHDDGRVDAVFEHGGHSPTGRVRYIDADIRQYSQWGFRYLKVDCHPKDDEIAELRAAIDTHAPDLILSLSANYSTADIARVGHWANAWRTSGDLIDTWFNLRGKIRRLGDWGALGRPHHWDDPDMLVVGHVGPGWNAPLQPTRLDPEEQYLHFSLWSMAAAPLLIGADLTQLDTFTFKLLANPEVIAIDQDPLGLPGRRVLRDDTALTEVWHRRLADGSDAVCLVNLGERSQRISAPLKRLGIAGKRTLRDCWRQRDVGTAGSEVSAEVAAHGAELFRLVR